MSKGRPLPSDAVVALTLFGLVLLAFGAGAMAVFLGNTLHVAAIEWQGLWALLGK